MTRMHRYSDVDTWLAAPGRAKGFVTPPTIEQILSGEIRLILRERAAPLLVRDTPYADQSSYTWRRIAGGQLESLCLRPQTWAVSLRSVDRYIRERKMYAEDFTMEQVGKILGLYRSGTLHRVLSSGRLMLVRDPNTIKSKRALRSSVLTFLQSLLAQSGSHMTAEDWIDDRLNSTEPLLTVPETAERLGLIQDDVRTLLREGYIFFIPSPGGSKLFVSPDSVAFYQEQAQPLTVLELARIFGASKDSIYRWNQQGLLTCPLHQHETPLTYYRWCMVAYVRERAFPGTNAVRWVRNALDSKRVLWTEHVVRERGIAPRQLMAAAYAGRISAIRNPAGNPVYVAGTVRREAGN